MDPSAPPNLEKPPPYSPTDPKVHGAGNTQYQQYGYPPYPQPQAYAYPPYPPAQASVPPAFVCGSTANLLGPRACPQGAYGTNVNIQTSEIVFVGGCPICRVGVLETEFSCAGVLCAILFFPLGVLCCLAMREKRCSNCGVVIS